MSRLSEFEAILADPRYTGETIEDHVELASTVLDEARIRMFYALGSTGICATDARDIATAAFDRMKANSAEAQYLDELCGVMELCIASIRKSFSGE